MLKSYASVCLAVLVASCSRGSPGSAPVAGASATAPRPDAIASTLDFERRNELFEAGLPEDEAHYSQTSTLQTSAVYEGYFAREALADHS